MANTFMLLDAAPNSNGGGMSFLLMMVLIFAIMYFFMIRPQNKKQKEIQKFRKGLEVGQEVCTSGGIYGKVKELEDTYVMLEISPNVRIKIDRNSIYASPAAYQQK